VAEDIILGIIRCMDPKDLQIRSYTGGMASTNGYLLGSSKDGDTCLLIDAPLGVSQWLENLDELPTDLLLTHQHYDHVEDVAKMVAKGVRLHSFSPYSDDLTLEKLLQQSGIPIKVEPYKVENLLEGKSELEAGGLQFSLEHVPGHSPDSVVFINNGVAFGGDTLFAGGVGRADLPQGDMELLLTGIRSKLFTLPPETRVFPGHGPDTTIQAEQSTNPFL
jgi:hydroxyacylglutathione hydrolase